ncbi:MAG: hypothetical protein SCALA702_38550 [Melioribacteraceae bacterium]|nr:MAG: hypothetical protein SCALA702_38550 [Melioribacteraceae bacterium]
MIDKSILITYIMYVVIQVKATKVNLLYKTMRQQTYLNNHIASKMIETNQ